MARRPADWPWSSTPAHLAGRDDVLINVKPLLARVDDVAQFISQEADPAPYCLMSNHYHLIVETPDGNLSKGMRQLNGVYTQANNRSHGRSGHLFQGRFKGILVDGDSYLLELTRYLCPIRYVTIW